jgi:hypothetical protein
VRQNHLPPPGRVAEDPVRAAPHAITWLLALLPVVAGCELGTVADEDPQEPEFIEGVGLDTVAEGLNVPTYLVSPPGDNRLFVTERTGAVRIIENDQLLPTAFLDLRSEVSSAGSEQGLLGLAFHPAFVVNGRFFVSYTDTEGDSRIVEYHAESPSNVADPQSASLVLQVEQPFQNHNGGHIAFGPDGMLYIGLGDGGGSLDPDGNGQDLTTLLGKLLRIDVDGEAPYVIPADNPFADSNDVRPEIWAYGLRNPWRFAWDPTDNTFYVADVGQDSWEEVNYVPGTDEGVNYGWSLLEGPQCFGDLGLCEDADAHTPQIIYNHTVGCAVVGGTVYRGSLLPQLSNRYIFGDNCAGWIRAADVAYPTLIDVGLLNTFPGASITSFGEDAIGELYVLTGEGRVARMVPVPIT